MNDKAKNVMLVVAVAIGIGVLLFANSENRGRTDVAMEYSQFLSDVNAGRVDKVLIDGSAIAIHLTDGNSAYTYSPEADNGPLIKDLLDNHVSIEARPPQHQSVLMQLFISWLRYHQRVCKKVKAMYPFCSNQQRTGWQAREKGAHRHERAKHRRG